MGKPWTGPSPNPQTAVVAPSGVLGANLWLRAKQDLTVSERGWTPVKPTMEEAAPWPTALPSLCTTQPFLGGDTAWCCSNRCSKGRGHGDMAMEPELRRASPAVLPSCPSGPHLVLHAVRDSCEPQLHEAEL